MEAFEHAKKLRGYELAFAAVLIAGAISPGLLAVWLFAPEFVQQTGISHLLLLSVAITAPIIALNGTLMAMLPRGRGLPQATRNNIPIFVFVGCCSILFVFLIPLLLAYLSHASREQFAKYVFSAEGVFCLNLATKRLRARWRRKTLKWAKETSLKYPKQ